MASRAGGPTLGSVLSVYLKQCEVLGCDACPAIVTLLPDTSTGLHELTTIDVNNAVLGTQGFQALLAVIKLSHGLRALCLANNAIDDACLVLLVQILTGRKALAYLDLRHNPLGLATGPDLAAFVHHNPNVQWLLLDHTLVGADIHNIVGLSASAMLLLPLPLAHAWPCLSTGWVLNRRFEEILVLLFLWSKMEKWVFVERLKRERRAQSCL